MAIKKKICAGCGVHSIEGKEWINVDKYDTKFQNCLYDLEQTPWPWPDNSVDEMLWNHSMEHVGQDPAVFLKIMQEIYRVCCDGATIHINAPHIRHDEYWGDPTHVRPISADMFVLFSKKANQAFRDNNGANSCFGFLLNVDFEVTLNELVLDPRFTYLKDDPNWQRMAALNNNVVREIKIRLKVIKPDA